MKYTNLKSYRFITLYVLAFVFSGLIIYLSIPFFFNYDKFKNKTHFELSQNFKVNIKVLGDVNYSILPTPRLVIKDIKVFDLLNSKKELASIEKLNLKIPFLQLVSANKFNFTEIKINRSLFKINLNDLGKYYEFIKDKNISKIIDFSKSTVVFYDNNEIVNSIKNFNLKFFQRNYFEQAELNGEFIGDKINIIYKNNKSKQPFKNISIRFKNLRINSKIFFYPGVEKKNRLKINFYDHNFISGFEYGKGTILLKNGQYKNRYFDTKLEGNIDVTPFFNFNLNFDTRALFFSNILKDLSKKSEFEMIEDLKVNKKFNGRFNFNIKNIYSKSKLVKSAETDFEFLNGDIILHKLILNFGKIGATDISGKIIQKENYSLFKFENNLFIDNSKLLFNKLNISSDFTDFQHGTKNFTLIGNINLNKLKLRVDELVAGEKIVSDRKKFIEKNLNEIFLSNGISDLFNIKRIAEFLIVTLQ